MRALLLLSVPALALTACATPREACISSAQRELRIIDRLVAETQANIARGYAVEERTEVVTVRGTCIGTNDDGSSFTFSCPETETRTRTEPVAIDLAAERAKLDSLLERQAAQRSATEAAIQQCLVLNPE